MSISEGHGRFDVAVHGGEVPEEDGAGELFSTGGEVVGDKKGSLGKRDGGILVVVAIVVIVVVVVIVVIVVLVLVVVAHETQ